MRKFLLNKGWSYFEANLFQSMIRNIYYLSVLLLAFHMFVFCKYDISLNEWKIMSAWVKKDLYCEFLHIGWEKVTYPGEYFEWHVSKKFMMKDQYVLAIVSKFKYTFFKMIMLTIMSIITSGIITLLCFSDSFFENRNLQEQIDSFKKKYFEDEKELKRTIDQLKAELSAKPKVQPIPPISPIRSRDLGNGRGSV